MPSANTIAFIFPGQGSQSPGMGRELYDAFPESRDIMDRADAALGRPLSKLCFEGPEEELRQTANAQPALYTVSMAAVAALRTRGIDCGAAAGHSLGEYSALGAADVFDFEDGLMLLSQRGAAMQAAGAERPGAMAAVLGPAEIAEAACREATQGVAVVANINSPEQVVISGDPAAVAEAIEAAKARGVKRVVPLPVSGAFHSPLVEKAVDAMRVALAGVEFREPRLKVVANVTGAPIQSASQIPGLLAQQITGCVRWVDCMNALSALGIQTFVEVGPGKVLAGLSKRINKDWTVYSCGTPAEVESVVQALGG